SSCMSALTADSALGEQIRLDLLDMATLWADLHVALAPDAGAEIAAGEALDVLGEAERVFGPSPVLYKERQALAGRLGLDDLAQRSAEAASRSPPRNAWEHYAVGRHYFGAGDLKNAAGEFQSAVDLEPRGFWPRYYQAACAYRLRDFADAASGFDVCVALAPDLA